MTVRTADRDDVDAIRRVAQRSWERDYPDILTRETVVEGVGDWYAPSEIEAACDRGRTVLLVAEADGDVVGFAHATWTDQDDGWVLRIYVDPDHRREGLGRELLERTGVELSQHGVDRLNATVLADNEPGNAFYEHFGFELAEETETTIGGESYPENRYVLAADDGIGDD